MSDAAVIELLISNGLHGTNSRQALRQLEMQRNDPNFVAALAGTFGAVEPQIELPAIAHGYPWPVIRQVAGWVLKTVVQQGISEEAMGSAAGASISVLQEESDDRRLISAAAVVIARLTMIGGVEWWAANNLDLSGLLLNDMLVSNSPNRVTAALLCLQYLVEDAPNHLGPAAGSIIDSVGDVAINHGDARVRGIALGVLAAVYEFGFELDWRVENLSPLQEGLAHGSVRTAGAISTALSQFTTLEHEVAAKVFRTAAYLVEYLSYLESSPETSNGLLTMFAVWSQAVYDATTPNMTAPEVATEALSFASAAYNTWEKTGGLDSIAALCDALSGNLEVLLDNILHHMIMKDEEEFEMLETDGYAHRDRHVRRRPGKKAKRSGDEGKADGDDGDELCPEASVRNAACLAIEFMAFVEPQRVAAHVVMRAHEMLAVQDWHQPECAICALGSIFAGCQNELIASLPTLIPMIGAAVGDGQPDQGNHVATMSICIFTLMKFSSWTIAHRQDLFDNTVVCVLPCLTSLSKRVQHAAVTFVRKVLEDALLLDPQGGGPLRNHLPDLMGTLYTCLPVYHTNNLHQLCTTVSLLIPIMGGAENVASSIEPFEAEFAKRLPLLQQTMQTRYMDGNLQQSVDCDAFELGYVVAMAYAAMSMGGDVTNQAMNAISTWVEVLKFALQCECGDDDAGIFQSPVNLISQLMNLADQSTFGAFISQNNLEFVQMMIYIATTVPDAPTRSAVLATFYNLLECYGLEVIPSVDELIGAMIKFPTAAEDTGVAADCGLLTSKLIELANPPTDHLMRYVAVLASQVRGDTVDNASMILLAESVGCVMQMYPAHFTLAQASQVALALCRGHNNPYKAASTQGIAAIIEGYAQADSSSLEELDWTLTAFVKLICSWHSDARHHEGLTDTIGSLLSNASQHPALSLTLQREIYDRLPATMIQLMATAYGLPT